MKTIREAFKEDPSLTVVATLMLCMVVLIALVASVVYLPQLFADLHAPATQGVNSLMQFVSLLMTIVGFIAIYVDRRAKGKARQQPDQDWQEYFANFRQPNQPKRMRLAMGFEWRTIRNGQTTIHSATWAMA